jgi:phenylpropionate dioxygenase-like ring-hydroxylating dioxygenase large terminal subunit
MGSIMIKDQWYVVLESKQVADKPVGVTRLGEKLVFWRGADSKIQAAFDRCPHRGVALSIAENKEGVLQCPFHGFEFDGSGNCILIPANGRNGVIPAAMRLNTYPTYEKNGLIWLWWGTNPPKDMLEPQFFENLDDSFQYATIQQHWDAHYSRVIENQLDVVHLPFVHRNSIGRGNRTVVDGPLVEWHGDTMIYTHVFNRLDDGILPKKPSEITSKSESRVHLEFIFPNIWQNYIGDDIRVFAAFIPIDEEHSILLIRFYQRFLTLPILGKFVAWLAMPMNKSIALEDQRVVITQTPKPSGLKSGEILIQGDIPIIEYRKKRAELQNR